MSTARVDFTRGAAERIARVVRIVETGERDGQPLRFGKVDTGGGGGKAFRVCTFEGAWPIGQEKIIQFRGTTATVSAMNLFASVSGSCGERDCAIAKDGDWYLVAVQCE